MPTASKVLNALRLLDANESATIRRDTTLTHPTLYLEEKTSASGFG
jgi:hypothetical protein